MRKEDKALAIEQVSAKLKEYAHFYLVDTAGLNAQQTSDLRRKCFGADIKMVVVKNTLFEKALESAEIDYSGLYPALVGNTAVMFSNVANAPAKLIKDFAGKNELIKLKAAYAEEGIFVGAEHLSELCAIKSKNELIADVVALLQSPAKNVISGLQGAAGNKIHGLLKTLGERPE